MSDSGAEGQPDSSEEEESQTFVADVVHFGKSYKYKIPSFPVVTLDLRHAVIHGVDEESGSTDYQMHSSEMTRGRRNL